MSRLNQYFSDEELQCKATHIVKLNPIFEDDLFALREKLGEPMTVNSCCRSREHNKEVGGNPHSFHVYDFPYYNTGGCAAIDIKRQDDDYNDKLAKTAWDMGFSIGVHPNFLHLDAREATVGMKQTVFPYAGATTEEDLNNFKNLVGYSA